MRSSTAVISLNPAFILGPLGGTQTLWQFPNKSLARWIAGKNAEARESSRWKERREEQQWFSKEVVEVIRTKTRLGRALVGLPMGRVRTIEVRSVWVRRGKGEKGGPRKKPEDFLLLGRLPRESRLWNERGEQAKKSPPPLVSSGVARLTSYRC